MPGSTVLAAVLIAAGTLGSLSASAQLISQNPTDTASIARDLSLLPDAPDAVSASDAQQTDPPLARQTLPKPSGQNQQQAPAPPSLGDLGLSPSQTKPDPDLQARLDRHTRMLRIHQRLGIITLAPLAGACITSAMAPVNPRTHKDNEVGRDIHVAFGSASVAMYALTASYAIRAPKVSERPARGGIKWHKYLIYVHGPGMVLTPILGAMAFNQINNGEKVHGIASAHAAVAWTTVAAYGAAIVAVSWPIHVGSWKL